MPIWTLHGNGRTVAPGAVVEPDERLNWPATIAIGVQHVVAMFGATFLVPVLTGFPVSTTLLFSGVGTILFLIVTRNKLPSYLGSSFAFIAPVTAATASAGMGSALAGIVAVGILLAAVGFIVQFAGLGWIDKLMPPVVAGAIVALIGFNLAPVAWTQLPAGAADGDHHARRGHPVQRAVPRLPRPHLDLPRRRSSATSSPLHPRRGRLHRRRRGRLDRAAPSSTSPTSRSARHVERASRCSCPSCSCSSPRTSGTCAASRR